MRLGVSMGYVLGSSGDDVVALAREAERLGYAVAWVAEAYGSDAATVLSYVAAKTERIDIGAAVFQIPARTPAMTAMTAATLDLLSGGRFRLGLGAVRPAGVRGMARRPLRQATRAHPRVRRGGPAGTRAADACDTRGSSSRSRSPTARARHSS